MQGKYFELHKAYEPLYFFHDCATKYWKKQKFNNENFRR